MLNPFARRGNPHTLLVGMAGIKMGDRFVQVGCAHGGRLGALAAQVGLSGDAAAIVPDAAAAARAEKGAAAAGALVDVKVAPPTRLAAGDRAFDVAAIDDTSGLLGAMSPGDRAAAFAELVRVLRPGGRALLVRAAPRGGLLGRLAPTPAEPPGAGTEDVVAALGVAGFKSVRVLAAREGLAFIEGIKPR